MTAFDINHDGYLDINEQLLREVKELGRIIDDLNAELQLIPQAVWGDVQPIWQADQATWNARYQEMLGNINVTTMSSLKIHEIFRDGDYNGTRIMLQ